MRAKGATLEAPFFLLPPFAVWRKLLSHSQQMGWLVGAAGIELHFKIRKTHAFQRVAAALSFNRYKRYKARPPGPEISVQISNLVDSVSLTGRITSSPPRILHPMLHPNQDHKTTRRG